MSPGGQAEPESKGENEQLPPDRDEFTRHESGLLESEEKFRAIFRNGPDALYLSTLEEGRTIDINEAFEELFGYSREEAIGRTALELGVYFDPTERVAVITELKAKGRISGFILEGRKKGGEVFTGSLSAVVLMLGGVPHIAGAVRDITGIRRAEETVRHDETLLRALLRISQYRAKTVPDFLDFSLGEVVSLTGSTLGCIFSYDEHSREFVLSSCSGWTGDPREAAAPRDCCGVPWGEAWDEAVRQRQAVVRNGFHVSNSSREEDSGADAPLQRLMTVPVLAGDRIVAVAGVAGKGSAYDEADVLQISVLMDSVWKSVGVRTAEQALREANDRYLTIAKCIPDTIWSMDLSGRFTYVSPGIERLHGRTVGECLTLTYRDLVEPGQVAHLELILSEEMQRAALPECDRNIVRTFETELLRKDGTTIWAEVSASFIWSDEGKPIGFTGVTRDITERKHAEAERVKLSAQLAQAQKMESVGRLAGGVAHDFNNWLTVINGYSSLVLAGLSSADPLREQVEEVLKAGERAAGLTRQLLAFSRKQMLQPRILDLNNVVEDMGSMLKRLMGEDVEVRFALSAESPLVRADPHQLEQVIMNLAVNARDAMPNGGCLLLETSVVERDENYAVAHPEARPGRYAMLALSDTGVGMDEATRLRIFEPFFTTKAVGQGTGLGLSMVQGMVAQSGGYVNVYSEPGRGTTFKIHLPALARAAADTDTPEPAPMLRGRETILLVEDQESVRRYAAAALSSYGYRMLQAANASEALMICELERGRIDLVLTDVVMPHTSGRELASQLAKMRPGIHVLFMSGYTDNVIMQHGVLDEHAHFIQKPFSPQELAGKIRAILGKSAPTARILVADDETGVRSFLRTLLERAGFEVLEAADGKQALYQVRSNHVELVIMDLVMPEQEGIETIRALRLEFPNIGIIAISGAFGGQFLSTAKALGADGVLEKPVSPQLMLATVEAVMARRR